PAGQRIFSGQGIDVAKWLTEHGNSETLYLLPVRPHTSPTTRPELFSIRTYYEGQSAIAYPELDEASLRAVLAQLAVNRALVKVLLPEHLGVDPKGLISFLLEPHGTLVDEELIYGFTVWTYRLLSPAEDFASDMTEKPLDVRFGAHLQLVNYTIEQERITAGQPLWVKMTWTILEPTDKDCGTQLALTDANGYVIARTDRMLLDDDFFRTTSHWQPGRLSSAYYRLSIPRETPPGKYRLGIVAYETNGERLAPSRDGQGDLTLPLAEIEVVPSSPPITTGYPDADYAIDVAMTPSLHLIGAEVSSTVARSGDLLRITLTWQARSSLDENLYLSLGLSRQGKVYALTSPHPLVSQTYPTSVWQPGETLRVNYPFLLPADLESGEYILGLRLLVFPDQRVISEIALQKLNVEARTHRFTIPPIEQPLSLHFGDSILLLGYDRPVVSIPDREIRVRLYWQASAPLEDSYIVFLHLVDKSNAIVAQIDTLPGNGDAPTTGWVVGEVITDTLRLPLPATLPAGSYRLILGMYHSVSGTRLPIAGLSGTGDSLVLEEIEVAD
ncbi:MAG: hypothetical protein ACP5R2_07285, partial [Anaerolineae bacterium]